MGVFRTTNGDIAVGVEDGGFRVFQTQTNGNEVGELLGLDQEDEFVRANLADFINEQLGVGCPEEGVYVAKNCN